MRGSGGQSPDSWIRLLNSVLASRARFRRFLLLVALALATVLVLVVTCGPTALTAVTAVAPIRRLFGR